MQAWRKGISNGHASHFGKQITPTVDHCSAQIHYQLLQEVFCMLYLLLDIFDVPSHWVHCLLLLVWRNNKITKQYMVCCAINNMAAEEL